MNVLIVIILIVVGAFFIWQLCLFIRDLIKHIKNKKNKTDSNNSADKDSAKKGE